MKDDAGVDTDKIISVFFGVGLDEPRGRTVMEAFSKSTRTCRSSASQRKKMGPASHSGQPGRAGQDPTASGVYNTLKGAPKQTVLFHVTDIDGLEGTVGKLYRLIGESWSFCPADIPHKENVFSKYELTMVSRCIEIRMNGGRVEELHLAAGSFLNGRVRPAKPLET